MAPLIRPKMLLIGSPGSGKSFYGKLISKEWDIPFRSMGNELRARMTPELKERMAQGKLAPSSAVLDVYKSLTPELRGGFALDGFPRSIEQVGLFEQAISEVPELRPSFALHLSLRRDLTVRKLLGRRECESCKKGWNVEHICEGEVYMPAILPPCGSSTHCSCGTAFGTRSDDTPEIVESRLNTHDELWSNMQKELRGLIPVVDYTITNGSQTAWPEIRDVIADASAKYA